jgi:hypothetical protein
MTHWELIHTTERDGFAICLYSTPETEPIDWDFDSPAHRQELISKINSGDVQYFIAKVVALKAGITLAEEYLGWCCYETYDEFIADAYFEDMVSNAVETAKAAITRLLEESK